MRRKNRSRTRPLNPETEDACEALNYPGMSDTKKRFEELCREAAQCRVCPRMAEERAVLGPANGPLNVKVLFVAEAPGRFGAGKTGIPFKGDRSGKNFEELLAHIGLTRKDVFITNAVLCNPLKDGSNHRPTAKEIKNCSGYLRSTLELVRPRVVVTLGAVGLQAINLLTGSKYSLKEAATRPQELEDFILLPLYHPSPRVANWKRPMSSQKRDFKKILTLIKSGH